MKNFIIRLGEAVSIVCLIAFIMFINAEDKISLKSAEELGQTVISVMELSGTVSGDEKDIKKQFGIEPSLYESFFFLRSEDVMDVRELLIIKVKDSSSGRDVLTAVEKVLTEKKNLFESYAPVQSALLEKAVLTYEGGFVFFAVGEESSAAYSEFSNNL